MGVRVGEVLRWFYVFFQSMLFLGGVLCFFFNVRVRGFLRQVVATDPAGGEKSYMQSKYYRMYC